MFLDPWIVLTGLFGLTALGSVVVTLKDHDDFWTSWSITSGLGLPLVAGYAILVPDTFWVGLVCLPLLLPGFALAISALSGQPKDFKNYALLSLNPVAWIALGLWNKHIPAEKYNSQGELRLCRICSATVVSRQEHCSYCGYRTSLKPRNEETRYRLYCAEGNSRSYRNRPGLSFPPKRIPNSLEKRNNVFDRIKAETSRMRDIDLSRRFVVTDEAGRRVTAIKDKLLGLIDELCCVRLDLEFNRMASSVSAVEIFASHPTALSVDDLHSHLERILVEFGDWRNDYLERYDSDSVRRRMEEKELSLRLAIQEITMLRVAVIASKTSVLAGGGHGQTIALAESDYHAWMDKIDYEIYRLEAEKDLSEEPNES